MTKKELNKNLNKAKKEKNDEFYTRIEDIEKELTHYKSQLKGKVVLCNCDNPTESNFWKYFYLNFQHLGLKRLIATHFNPSSPTYKLEYDGKNITKTPLQQNGDFRSPECIELLKESDVVITNPPFSLFREYVKQLVDYEKKFLIIGNKNAIKYKEIFPLIQKNKVWVGETSFSKDMLFRAPLSIDLDKKPKTAIREVEGVKYLRSPSIWFTNLEVKKRHEELILYKEYKSKDYPKYDNYDAINVNKTSEIPKDYFDMIGVPITFLDKYNPNQFELLEHLGWGVIKGKATYSRIIIKRKVK